MKNVLCVAALLLMSAPALAGDGQVPSSTLSELGLSGMQVISDVDGLAVRGLSASAASGGTSLIFGQLVFNDDNGTQFVVGSDVNTARATSENAGLNASAQAEHEQGSRLELSLGPIDIGGTEAFNGLLDGRAGFALSDFAGIGFARGE